MVRGTDIDHNCFVGNMYQTVIFVIIIHGFVDILFFLVFVTFILTLIF